MAWLLLPIPLALQALAMIFDEFYFHLQRGLPRWERLGHPLDTLSVGLCFAWCWLAPYSEAGLIAYVCFATLSCLLVTKDEFVHHQHCGPLEGWLHALLFLLHPVVLIAAWKMWSLGSFALILKLQTGLLAVFFFIPNLLLEFFLERLK